MTRGRYNVKKWIQIIILAAAALSTKAFAGKILYIGDSHSTAPHAPFGERMNALLRTLPNAEISFHSRCGSTVNWWYAGSTGKCGYFDQEPTGTAQAGMNSPTPLVTEMMDRFQPTFMIVQLGANYMTGSDWAANAKKDIQKLVDDLRFHGIPCLWIGQPDFRLPTDPEQAQTVLKRRDDLIFTIRETVEPVCTYVDSTTLTRYPAVGGDGHHYSMKEGKEIGFAWAESVFRQFVIPAYLE
jgi:hypothetical protein